MHEADICSLQLSTDRIHLMADSLLDSAACISISGVLPAELEHEFYTFTFLKTLQVIHLFLIWIEELCDDPKKVGQPEKRSFSFGPMQMSKETIDDLDVSII